MCACANDLLSVPTPEEEGTWLSVLVRDLGPVCGLYGLVLVYTGLQCGWRRWLILTTLNNIYIEKSVKKKNAIWCIHVNMPSPN